MRTPKNPYASNPYETGIANQAAFTVGTETSNAITVTIQLKDGVTNVADRTALRVFLSDNADGSTFSATAPTSALAVAAGQSIIAEGTTKSAEVVSDASGVIALTITYITGAKTWYLVLVMPDGRLVISPAIVFA